jgi:hypothetical protein
LADPRSSAREDSTGLRAVGCSAPTTYKIPSLKIGFKRIKYRYVIFF